MANNLATLRTRLSVALRDPAFQVWESTELDDLLNSATAQLYPRAARTIAAAVWPLAEDQEDFALPTGVIVGDISRVDVAEVATDRYLFTLAPGTWETYGEGSAARLFVNRSFSNTAHYFIVHGYGAYDLTTNLPGDTLVPFILATARAEAWRAMVGERARFTKWLTQNQKENVSVNELAQMIAMAEAEAEKHYSRMKTWRKPKPAR